jgi:hypothetical protein
MDLRDNKQTVCEERKLNTEELHGLHSSPNISVIKSWIRWAGNMAYMGEKCIQFR